ncbi:hypothetical protein [uncultured Paracoccus sp.]|uniref:hypothetical protein n=1 Tax=uncultured Paracoccus sp. TaxID=189685 RepID=UPI002606DB38|nr:hypothetical protein [uncultured Paracoccus sp.]
MMRVFWAQYQIVVDGEPKAFAFAFECSLAGADEIAAALAEHGVVGGNRLDLVADGRGGSMIRGRSGCALGLTGLVAIQAYRRQVWEPEE